MKKITILALDHCKKCQATKDKLTEMGIKYKSVSCTDNPEQCDKCEKLTGVFSYPMIILENQKDLMNTEKTIVYFGDEADNLNKKILLEKLNLLKCEIRHQLPSNLRAAAQFTKDGML